MVATDKPKRHGEPYEKDKYIAYFCMEYGLASHFKIYSGGLGILAGDHLKAAKDAGVPLVGIGIKWQQGYVEQRMTPEGQVVDCYRSLEGSSLEDTGIIVHVTIREDRVPVKVWKTEAFGNVPLYLLDTAVSESPYHWVTRQLYGGTEEERVAQEIVLGVGGLRALQALKIPVITYHFNEGHAVLAGLALLRDKMDRGADFHSAWSDTRQQIVFTTHTPIPAGNESHPLARLRYMSAHQGLTIEQLAEIGGTPFNMTVAGLRLSRQANSVAALHLETTKSMWRSVKGKAPLINITNGVHVPTWMDERLNRSSLTVAHVKRVHSENRSELLELVKERKGIQLNPQGLVVGFARRAAPYKRSDLIFSQMERIEPLLKQQRLQLIFSGKAHPMDSKGKEMLKKLAKVQQQHPQSVVFLEDYDMALGALLTRGCDIWLNNPQRPKEACGTSGMKAAMNGVMNVSILDGWWPEACRHGVNGWAIGDEQVPATETAQDQRDAEALYQVLLEEVLPCFEDQHERWSEMMVASIMDTREAFSAERMIKAYCRELYHLAQE
ncbi:starch phosphorylase [Anoxynatronum buryatiense]|uniref:glycogen phosphorylase n=2 Tax=Anoxynatronum buryatiense TaxID=489973 RepID=A0AA46AKB8_9CLOT|nr:starch phosphorylase [Anoxynatronum buryatiense]